MVHVFRIEFAVVCVVCLCYNRPFDETLADIYVIIKQKHAVFFILRQWYYWISIEANFGTDKIMFMRI